MKKNFYIVALLLMLQLGAPTFSFAVRSVDEYQVKAAFIYNFTKFSRWPSEQQIKTAEKGTLVIGVLGHNPFGPHLQPLSHKRVQQRPVELVYLSATSDPKQLERCQVLFIRLKDEQQLCQILQQVRGKGILTISDQEGFTYNGGCIEFITQGNNIRFILNKRAIEQQRIELSYKVYSLALDVVEDNGC